MKNPEYRKLLSDGIVHKNEIDHVHKSGLSRSLFRDLRSKMYLSSCVFSLEAKMSILGLPNFCTIFLTDDLFNIHSVLSLKWRDS